MRFPGFTDEWERKPYAALCDIGSGRDYKHLGKGSIPVFGTGGYMTSVDDYLLDGETVFIGRKGTIDKPFYYNGKFWTVDTLFYTLNFHGILPRFLLNLFERTNWQKYNEASGVPSLSKSTIEKIEVNVPSVHEQQKIADLLSLLDERIATQNKIISRLESLILGIIQHCQRDGVKNGSWQKLRLADVMTKRDEINSNGYEVHSVSVTQGVVNQVEYLGRSFAAKDTSNYNIARLGNIIYTKSPTGQFPYGIIKRNFLITPAAISPLYGVFEPKTDAIGILIHYWFMSPINTTNYLHPLIQKGAKNTINITNSRFLEGSLSLPIKDKDAETIAKCLISIQKNLNIEVRLLNAHQAQKTYLLQKMFV